jgi:hypothetical protein
MGNPASVLLLLRLLLSSSKSKKEDASTIAKKLRGKVKVRAKVAVLLGALLLEVGAACVALLLVVLFVAFFYLYCLPFLLLR